MDFPETKYTPVVINGIFETEDADDGCLFRFENKEAFRLTDGAYAVITDALLEDGSIYSEVLKVKFVAADFPECTR